MPRSMIQGDTFPFLFGTASDSMGVLNLSMAHALEVRLRAPNPLGGSFMVTGVPTAIWPATNGFNWQYVWGLTDTANVGVYEVELVVTWDAGATEIQTFSADTVTITAPLT